MSIITIIKNIFNKRPTVKTFAAITMAYIKGEPKKVELFYDYNEIWMNTIYNKDERFMFAREAIRYRDRVIHNLRMQVSVDHKKSANEKLRLEIAHLRANNNDLTNRCAFLRQRPDLPAHRIPAYNVLIALQEKQAATRVDVNRIDVLDPKYARDGWIISGPLLDNNPDVIVTEKSDIKKIINLITNDGRYSDVDDYTATKIQLNYKYHPDSIAKDLKI